MFKIKVILFTITKKWDHLKIIWKYLKRMVLKRVSLLGNLVIDMTKFFNQALVGIYLVKEVKIITVLV